MARILEGRYADCDKVILVCDNLNTHTKGAFYEAFDPERARQLVLSQPCGRKGGSGIESMRSSHTRTSRA
jgi:hypothetical protein